MNSQGPIPLWMHCVSAFLEVFRFFFLYSRCLKHYIGVLSCHSFFILCAWPVETYFLQFHKMLCSLSSVSFITLFPEMHIDSISELLKVKKVKVASVVSNSATPWTVAHQTPLSMDSSGKNTGMNSHSLLQGIFPTQG